jgi:hypothetical protein
MPKSPSLALIHVYDAIERVELLRDLTVQAAERMIFDPLEPDDEGFDSPALHLLDVVPL